MDIDYRWTDGKDPVFHKFYLKTEEYYSSIVGGRQNRLAFVPYNVSDSISHVLIASAGEEDAGNSARYENYIVDYEITGSKSFTCVEVEVYEVVPIC